MQEEGARCPSQVTSSSLLLLLFFIVLIFIITLIIPLHILMNIFLSFPLLFLF